MKNIIKILSFVFVIQYANAQTVVKLKEFYNPFSIYKNNEVYSEIYYKDIDNYFTPFIGSWKYQNGTNTFVITIWKESMVPHPADSPYYYTDILYAHYRMYQNYGMSNQVEVYTSQKAIGNSSTIWPTVMVAASTTQNIMTGGIFDIAGPLNIEYVDGVKGFISMEINPNTLPLTAVWKVEHSVDMHGLNQPWDFVIPTNVILTKM